MLFCFTMILTYNIIVMIMFKKNIAVKGSVFTWIKEKIHYYYSELISLSNEACVEISMIYFMP